MILVPEIVFYDTIKFILNDTREEVSNQSIEKTRLYLLFNKTTLDKVMKLGNYNWLKQAETIFSKKEDEQRLLDVNIGYNLSRAHLPTIHILLPSETNAQENGLGFDEGYQKKLMLDETRFVPIYTRMFDATYNIMITSDNSTEVVLIYQFLRAMLISMKDHLSSSGILNMSYSGQDNFFTQEMIPPNVFHRSISINFKYEISVPQYFEDELVPFSLGLKMISDKVNLENS